MHNSVDAVDALDIIVFIILGFSLWVVFPWPVIATHHKDDFRFERYSSAEIRCVDSGLGFLGFAKFTIDPDKGRDITLLSPFQKCDRDYISQNSGRRLIVGYRTYTIRRSFISNVKVGEFEIRSTREAFLLRNITFFSIVGSLVFISVFVKYRIRFEPRAVPLW